MYSDCHRVQELSQCTAIVTGYRSCHSVQRLHSIQEISQCPLAVTEYRDFHRVLGLSQITGAAAGYR